MQFRTTSSKKNWGFSLLYDSDTLRFFTVVWHFRKKTEVSHAFEKKQRSLTTVVWQWHIRKKTEVSHYCSKKTKVSHYCCMTMTHSKKNWGISLLLYDNDTFEKKLRSLMLSKKNWGISLLLYDNDTFEKKLRSLMLSKKNWGISLLFKKNWGISLLLYDNDTHEKKLRYNDTFQKNWGFLQMWFQHKMKECSLEQLYLSLFLFQL